MRKSLTVLLTAGLAVGLYGATGCHHSSSSPSSPSDSGTDGALVDTGTAEAAPSDGAPTDGATEASVDAGCTFAAYVIELIDADTTATATPTTNLATNCTDDQNQADFSSLF